MKTIKILAIALFITITSSCQHKNNMNTENTNDTIPQAWEEMCNAPQGYPIEVYKGGLEKRDENGGIISSTGLNTKLSTGYHGWGESGGGMKRSNFVPTHINCTWLSYGEGVFYKINTPIDHDKMLKLFQEGYPNSLAFLNYGERRNVYYNSIIVGFAPGGVVVIWLYGACRQVEIGRYQGERTEIDPKEIAGLDQEVHVLFEPEFRAAILADPNVVPPEVQKANAGKPIPYGLWDSYRTRYAWRAVFEVLEEGIADTYDIEMYNGEKEQLFDVKFKENEFIKRAIPKGISFSWKDTEGQGYAANIDFDEETITNAFREMYKDNKEAKAEVVFTINHSNNFVTAMLRLDNRNIYINKGMKQEVYKTKR